MVSTSSHQAVGVVPTLVSRVAGTIVSGETLGGVMFISIYIPSLMG